MTGVPIYLQDEREHRRLLAVGLEQALEGKIRPVGSFTLAASQTTTAVNDLRAGKNSVILWMPLSATAAAAMDSLYVSSRGSQTFTLTHDSTADSDRTFAYIVIG